MKPEFARVLLEDMNNKKVFTAKYHAVCDCCGELIEDEEDLYFYGSKQKLCGECYGGILEELEKITGEEFYQL